MSRDVELNEPTLEELVNRVNGIYNSEMNDEEKYDLIFSTELSGAISEYLRLDYYDPDSSCGEDVSAYVIALNSAMLNQEHTFKVGEIVGYEYDSDERFKIIGIIPEWDKYEVVCIPGVELNDEPGRLLIKLPDQVTAIREYNDILYARIKEIQDGIINTSGFFD